MRQAAGLLLLWAVAAFAQDLNDLGRATTGIVRLPSGVLPVSKEIRLPDGSHDITITGHQTTLRVAPGFSGRAVLSCHNCRNLVIRDLTFDGDRATLETPMPLPGPGPNIPFAEFYPNNGILIENTNGLTLDRVRFVNIANFAVLVAHSSRIVISHAFVADCGSRNEKGVNNTSGGILLEEGNQDFTVADSVFENIRGNALWTHAYRKNPRNVRGRFLRNEFADIGRDAIQVGHATEVVVRGNVGRRIGMKLEDVDVEGGGTPVGIDTAGNVDKTLYESNRFEEVNGKCIDLDGFHDGTVRGNVCINRKKASDYAYGNFGISINNTNPDMRSQNITIEDNTLDGMKFGGIFVIGTRHIIQRNTLRHLNLAHCNDLQGTFACIVDLKEPGFLESGIYLASHAERPDPARNNLIAGNRISGWKMATACILAAPGVKMSENRIAGNVCRND